MTPQDAQPLRPSNQVESAVLLSGLQDIAWFACAKPAIAELKAANTDTVVITASPQFIASGIGMLELVGTAVCVNPTLLLRSHAVEHGRAIINPHEPLAIADLTGRQ